MIAEGIIRFFYWTNRQLGHGGLLTLFLLLTSLVLTSIGLVQVVREVSYYVLLPYVVLGAWLGWYASRWRGWQAGIFGFTVGLGLTLLHIGRIAPLALQFLNSSAQSSTFYPSIPSITALARTLQAVFELHSGVTGLAFRLLTWLLALSEGRGLFDPLAVALAWGLIIWFISFWAGWQQHRYRRPILALAPGVTLLTAMLFFTNSRSLYLIAVLGTGCLLQGTSRYLRDEKRWHTSHVDFPDLNYDLGIAVIGLALFLSTAAFVLPSISIDRITQLVQDVFSRDQDETSPVAESLGLRILAKPESSFKSVATPGLARQHLIGSGPELSEQVVMWVYPSGYNPVMASYQFPIGETLPAPPGYYWRSYSYDGYTGHGWYSTTYQENDRQSSEPIFLPDERLQSNGAFAHHRFAYLTEEVNNLYSPGELVFVDRPYQLAWRNPQDIFGARLASGEVAVTAQVPDASEQELRQAGRDYPDWLSRRYLALPENLPERVRDLALDLTATQPTPYDQAVAIERFLRTYPYTLDLPAPPTGRDVADYFLFDLQEGYCDYYATAMVVMARAAGLPARMAIGYATGQWHPMTGYFVVSEAEAHSWPEIYFPGHGWIAFEPTASLTPLIRSGEQKQGGNPTAVPPPLPSRVVLPNNLGNWSGYLLAFVGLIAGLLLLVEYADRWRLRHMPAQAAITLLYHRLGNHAQRLAVQPRFADTPAEFTNRLSSRLKALDPAGGDEYSDLPEEAIWLAEEYATARYSTHSPDRRKHLQIIQRWLKMRSQLRRVWLKSIRLPRK